MFARQESEGCRGQGRPYLTFARHSIWQFSFSGHSVQFLTLRSGLPKADEKAGLDLPKQVISLPIHVCPYGEDTSGEQLVCSNRTLLLENESARIVPMQMSKRPSECYSFTDEMGSFLHALESPRCHLPIIKKSLPPA